MDGCISWKWVSFIIHQKCVIQDVLKMTGEEVSQPSYSGVLSCVRKSVCILWLQTDQVSVAPHKGQRLEETNQTKQHECSTGAERGTKHGAHDKCWLSGPCPGHAADCAHPHILTPVLVRIQQYTTYLISKSMDWCVQCCHILPWVEWWVKSESIMHHLALS